jgi:hypothetical protein
VVFSTVLQNAISDSEPDPNNISTVIARVLDYLLTEAPAHIGEASPTGPPWTLTAQPNPFSRQTRLLFNMPPHSAAAPLELALIDISGRRVKSLRFRPAEDGKGGVIWSGRDSNGRPVASGVYYARVRSREGESWTKLVLLR